MGVDYTPIDLIPSLYPPPKKKKKKKIESREPPLLHGWIEGVYKNRWTTKLY